MTQTTEQVELYELWANRLTERQRKNRLETAFRIMRLVGENQLILLKKTTQKNKFASLHHIYFYETVKTIWENVDFILALGKGKNRRFAFYPVRMIFENTFRLEYFLRQTIDAQKELASKEFSRILKRLYDNEIANGEVGDAQQFRGYYEDFSQGKLLDIDKVEEKSLEPFPNMRKLTKDSKINDAEGWYLHYQFLAEQAHGKLVFIVINQENEARTYRQSLFYLTTMIYEVLKNTDFKLGYITQKEVAEVIQKSQDIFKRPV